MRRWKTVGLLVVILCVMNAAGSVFAQQQMLESSVLTDDVASLAVTDSAESQSVEVKNFLGTETICVAPQDEVWIVSARQACLEGCSATEFDTQRLVSSQWEPNSFSELAVCHQSDPGHVTVMIVHGNNTNIEWALTRGMQFYERMFGQDPCGRNAVRFVILAWESEKVLHRPSQDYQLKATRAVGVGASVGALLNDLGGARPILVGYSLGTQVVLSALNEMAACESHDLSECRPGFQIAVIAPALEADFACEDLASICCNPLISEADIFVNRSDRVLLAARLLNRKRCDDRSIEPSLVGLARQGRLDSQRFHFHDVTGKVRNQHSLVNYIQSDTIQCRVREIVTAAASSRMGQAIGQVSEVDSDPKLAAEVTLTSAKPTEANVQSPVQR